MSIISTVQFYAILSAGIAAFSALSGHCGAARTVRLLSFLSLVFGILYLADATYFLSTGFAADLGLWFPPALPFRSVQVLFISKVTVAALLIGAGIQLWMHRRCGRIVLQILCGLAVLLWCLLSIPWLWMALDDPRQVSITILQHPSDVARHSVGHFVSLLLSGITSFLALCAPFIVVILFLGSRSVSEIFYKTPNASAVNGALPHK